MKKRPESNLSARQNLLLVELVKNPDIQAAARAAGIGRTTAYRWLAQPDFSNELTRRRDDAMTEALSSIKSQTTRAAMELNRLLDTEDERLRRMLCNDILRHAIRVRELEEIERRLIRLEQHMASQEKQFTTKSAKAVRSKR
ncbi:MAG: hypothetical protein KJN67_03650 [Pontiella sp.]|nr:hypothetical protein [Pontiella sp.]